MAVLGGGKGHAIAQGTDAVRKCCISTIRVRWLKNGYVGVGQLAERGQSCVLVPRREGVKRELREVH